MKRIMAMVLVGGLMILGNQTAKGSLVAKDSADFGGAYEANVMPQNDSPAWPQEGIGSAGIVGGVLHVSNDTDGKSLAWDQAGWTPDYSTGFTLEMKVQALSDGSRGRATQVGAGGGVNARSVLILTTNSTLWLEDGNTITLDSSSNSDAFHVIRFAYEPSAGFHVWRDGVDLGIQIQGYSADASELYFGDWSNGGSAYDVDYIRWDQTGAFAPIPEPMTLSLLIFGLPSILRRR